MDRDPNPADAAHAMKTALRYQQQAARRGRFGREVPAAPATDDVQTAEARTTMQTDGPDGTGESGVYMIDAHAVAEAILDRLIAGRTLAVPPPPEPSR